MDRRERNPDSLEAMHTQLEGWQSRIWTALPGIIQSFDPVHQTAVVQPALQGLVTSQTGAQSWVNMPLLVDCPVQFPRGGGLALTFPVTAGDECLVICASRCIDAWWQLGGVQVQAELRMHDLSDGMVLLGFNSVPKVMSNVSTTAAQLRDVAGDTYVSVAASGAIAVTALASVTVTAPAITLNGPVTVNGTLHATGAVTGDTTITAPTINGTTNVNFGGKSGVAHVHSGVQPGAGNTGAPV